jgi:U3 small nucleolar RNA-associated protein 23
MKINRQKHAKKVLKFYKQNYNYDLKVFNILIDGTFANEALKSKINISDQLPKYFDVDKKNCKILTTRCAIHETELLGRATYGAMVILKQFEIVECKHKREVVTREKCFNHLIKDSIENNLNTKYLIATQVITLIKLKYFLNDKTQN